MFFVIRGVALGELKLIYPAESVMRDSEVSPSLGYNATEKNNNNVLNVWYRYLIAIF